jgi:hypothetical protein
MTRRAEKTRLSSGKKRRMKGNTENIAGETVA